MNVYKKFLHIIRQHAEALLLYEILMRSIGFLIGALLVLIFDLSVRQSSGDILVNTDLLGLFEGYRLIFLTFAIFAVMYVSLMEIVGLCYISAHEEKGAHVLAVLRYSAKRSASILQAYGLHVISAIFLCVFFFPVFDIGPAYLRTVAIPTFITDEISKYAVLPYAYAAVAGFVFLFLFRSAFTFHIFALNKQDFFTSIRDSWRITRRTVQLKGLLQWGVIMPFAIFAFMVLLTGALSYAMLSAVNALAVATIFIFPEGISLVLYTSWVYFLSTSVSLMIGPILICLLTAYLLVRSPSALDKSIIEEAKSFSKATETALRENINVASNGYMDSRAVIRIMRKPALILVFGAISFLTFSYVSSRFIYVYDDKPQRPAIISHRGESGHGASADGESGHAVLENSIEGFAAFIDSASGTREAIVTDRGTGDVAGEAGEKNTGSRLGIETDLQSLRDGTVIVFHDEDFKRVYGIDKKVADTSLADFDMLFGSTTAATSTRQGTSSPMNVMPRPVLLSELLQFIQEKKPCPALLEIKAYGGAEAAQNTVQRSIEEIRKRHLEACVYLGSLDQRVVDRIEEADPGIMSNQYIYTKAGDIGKFEIADAVSIEYSLVTERIVRDLKKAGKKTFVWTLNDQKMARQVYAYGIDGVITDDPAAIRDSFDSYEDVLSHVDPKVVTLFGKTFLVNLNDVWQFRLKFPFL